MFRQTYKALALSALAGQSTILPRPLIPFPFHHILPLSEMTEDYGTRHSLPSVMMRAGTSKGLFIHRHHMPADREKWGKFLSAAMGSREGDQKQIDGVGGATSTTSKVAIVSKSARPDADVDYTFVQVAIGHERVDFSGNCGNMASGVGPFAVDEGLVRARPGQTELDVRVFNTNTKRLLVETIKVRPDGLFNENGDHKIGGVIGTGSEIKVAFVDPAGSMTGKLFPTGQRKDILEVSSFPGLAPFTVCSTLIDVANPFILVDSATLPQMYHQIGPSAPESLQIIEAIRRTGAVKYRLAKDTAAASLVRGTPKIAILSSPEMRGIDDAGSDIEVTAFSMGKVHPTLQLTGAVCFGAAVCIEGTIAHELSKELYPTPPRTPPNELGNGFDLKSSGERQVRIRHRGGVIHVNVKIGQSISGNVEVEKVTVSRTARRLFEGNVLFIA